MSNQQTFSHRLSSLREQMGLSQDEFAKILGISRNYVSMMENGREPSRSLVRLVESLEKEHAGSSTQKPAPAKRSDPNAIDVNWIPVISWAHAGAATCYEELPSHWQERIPVSCRAPGAFGLLIEGDSMEPRCVAGDIVIVMPDEEPRNGCLVVAKLRDDGVIVRRFSKFGDNIRLTAYNPVYPPSEHTPDEFHWIYPVHSTVRREWH